MSDFVSMYEEARPTLAEAPRSKRREREAELQAMADAFSPKDCRALPAALKLAAFCVLCAMPALAVAGTNGYFEDAPEPYEFPVQTVEATQDVDVKADPIVVPITIRATAPKAKSTPRTPKTCRDFWLKTGGTVKHCDRFDSRIVKTAPKRRHLADLPWLK